MDTVLNEIKRLRKGKPLVIDYHNSNRYRLVVEESDGSKTAYYFSTPIYNCKNRKMIDMKFRLNDGTVYAVGSNANTTISQNVLIENADASCKIALPEKGAYISGQKVQCGSHTILPTTNGIAMKCKIKGLESIGFLLEMGQPFLNVRANNKCFALMKERFRPHVVFSCIGSMDATGNIIAPAKLDYQKITDKKYCVTVSATSPLAQYVLWECNLYENKLFQDTTVESMNPSSNNAFGGIGFIGNTSLYGEQWLYTRLDCSRMPEMMDKRINNVILHMPKFNSGAVELSAYRAAARFCSFGSNWSNKIASSAYVSDTLSENGYQSLDLTPLLIHPRTKTVINAEGMILKPKIKGSGFSVIATGDSYLAPQIVEINFR